MPSISEMFWGNEKKKAEEAEKQRKQQLEKNNESGRNRQAVEKLAREGLDFLQSRTQTNSMLEDIKQNILGGKGDIKPEICVTPIYYPIDYDSNNGDPRLTPTGEHSFVSSITLFLIGNIFTENESRRQHNKFSKKYRFGAVVYGDVRRSSIKTFDDCDSSGDYGRVMDFKEAQHMEKDRMNEIIKNALYERFQSLIFHMRNPG